MTEVNDDIAAAEAKKLDKAAALKKKVMEEMLAVHKMDSKTPKAEVELNMRIIKIVEAAMNVIIDELVKCPFCKGCQVD